MFYPFTIQSSVISQLQLETGTYYSATEDPDKWTRKAQLRQYLSSTNGLVDGKALKEVLFPKGKYHIFLSHSHGDLQIAQYLKAWFNINCGLKCFIDADVWENAYDLLMELDNKYSKNTTGNYDYDKCTQTAAHVYSMLSMALFEAIDEIECPILIESANSVTLEEGIKKSTLSPWIYEEVGYMGKLPHKIPSRFARTGYFSIGTESYMLAESIMDSIQMSHPLDTDEFEEIDVFDLKDIRQFSGTKALDRLYIRTNLLKKKLGW